MKFGEARATRGASSIAAGTISFEFSYESGPALLLNLDSGIMVAAPGALKTLRSAEKRHMCHLTAQGEVVCPGEGDYDIASILQFLSGEFSRRSTPLPSQKLILMAKLICEVLKSPLDDESVGWRASDALESVNQVLAAEPPVMLFFKYNMLPGNILATYFKEQGNYVAFHSVVEQWSDLRSPTKPGKPMPPAPCLPPSTPAPEPSPTGSTPSKPPAVKGRKRSR